MSSSNEKSLLKLIGGVLLTIIGLWFIYSLINGSGFGVSIGYNGEFGGGHMYVGTGAGVLGTISLLLLFLIKVLFVLFIVGLVAGLAIAIKKYIFTDEDIKQIKGTFTVKKINETGEFCAECGKKLNGEWKVCPFCGEIK